MISKTQTIFWITLVLTILTLACVAISFNITTELSPTQAFPLPYSNVLDYLFSHVSKENIRNHLYTFTEVLGWKVAGTQAEHHAADYIKKYFQSVGLKGVKLVPYQVLFSYPDPEHINTLQIIDTDDKVVFQAHQFEDLSLPFVKNQSSYSHHLRSLFLAYSGSGDIQGPLFYVAYARNEDFEAVKDKVGPLVVCFCRYGKISRALKAENAQSYGCGGLLIYADPDEFNKRENSIFYPDSEYLPASGAERGSLKNQDRGDYLTPAYPALPEAYRLHLRDAKLLTIPCQVIRQDDAFAIFELMGCTPKGVCESRECKLQARLSVKMQNIINETNNIIGFIPGKEEPDRYVLIGNHYDSWGPGSIDPNIGSAIVLELSRVLMAFHNETGWQPRRSIVFCEWGAEEFGSLGSREFVEQFSTILADRAVAYINTDVAVLGNYSIKFKGQALLKSLIFNSTKSVEEPYRNRDGSQTSLYDTYLSRFPDKKRKNKCPKVDEANTGSDYVHFIGLAGVPCLDVRYTYDESLGLSFYPLYHSAYENFHAFEHFIDPGFKYSEVVTKVMGDLALRLASETIIPYSVDEYVQHVNECVSEVIEKIKNTKELFSSEEITKIEFKTKLESMFDAGKQFIEEIKEVDMTNDLAVRALNDRMMLLEKAFLYKHTLEGRESVRNALHAPSASGKQVCLAEVNTMLDKFEHTKTDRVNAKEEILKELSRIHFFLDTAISIMHPQGFP